MTRGLIKVWNAFWAAIEYLDPPMFCRYHGHEWLNGPRMLRTKQRVCKRCLAVEPL